MVLDRITERAVCLVLFSLLVACSRASHPPPAATKQAATPSAAAIHQAPPAKVELPPPPPLSNGALFAVDAGPEERGSRDASSRSVAVWNDGTVVLAAPPRGAVVWRDAGRARSAVERPQVFGAAIDAGGERLALLVPHSTKSTENRLQVVDLRADRVLFDIEGTSLWRQVTWAGASVLLAQALGELETPLVVDLGGRASRHFDMQYDARVLGASADGALVIDRRNSSMSHRVDFIAAEGTTWVEDSFHYVDSAVTTSGLVLLMFSRYLHYEEHMSFWAEAYDLRAKERRTLPAALLHDATAAAAGPASFALGFTDGRVVVTGLQFEVTHTLRADGAVDALDFSPDGKLVASAHADGKVYVWSLGR